MGKGLTVFAAILAFITTWFLGTEAISGSGVYVYGLGGLISIFSTITTVFSNLDAVGVLYVILAILWALAPIMILIGIGVRPLAIIFGIILLIPGIGLILVLIGNATGVSSIYTIGGDLYLWIILSSHTPLVNGIIPYILLGDNSYYLVTFGGAIAGLLAIIGGATKRDK